MNAHHDSHFAQFSKIRDSSELQLEHFNVEPEEFSPCYPLGFRSRPVNTEKYVSTSTFWKKRGAEIEAEPHRRKHSVSEYKCFTQLIKGIPLRYKLSPDQLQPWATVQAILAILKPTTHPQKKQEKKSVD